MSPPPSLPWVHAWAWWRREGVHNFLNYVEHSYQVCVGPQLCPAGHQAPPSLNLVLWVPGGTPSPTGVLVLLSLDYLTSLFYYIPKSALAAVIIMAVAPLFDAKILRTLWRVKSMYVRTQGRQPLTWCPNAKGIFDYPSQPAALPWARAGALW